MRLFRPLLLALLLVPVAGCESLGYYAQAAGGHLQLMFARRSLDEVIKDPETPEEVRTRLGLAREMLDFARDELGLPADGQYATYVALERDAVVYNVMAAPRHSLEPVVWCFPVAGCVSYRGYFDERRAQAKAAELAADGLDVHVAGAAAYSTLGWFDDPLLSTFLMRPEGDLAELLFHELAHVLLYVPGDTTFNESFATFVGREGARRWLLHNGAEAERAAWEDRIFRRESFVRFVLDWRDRLRAGFEAAHRAGAHPEALEAVREALWTAMVSAWFAQRPEAAAGYDGFFRAEPSNARLNTVADYNTHLPAFGALFEQVGGDLDAFHARVRALSELDREARDALLDQLAGRGAAG